MCVRLSASGLAARGVGPDLDNEFVNRLHAAALRARASGFDGIAEAIEEILERELARSEDLPNNVADNDDTEPKARQSD